MALNRSRKRKNDPTGQASRRRKATRAFDVRLNRAENRIKPLIITLQPTRRTVTPISNVERTIVYDYNLTAEEIAELGAQIRVIINEELETTGETVPVGWFWGDQLAPPYRQGALEEANRIEQLIQAAVIAGFLAPQQNIPELITRTVPLEPTPPSGTFTPPPSGIAGLRPLPGQSQPVVGLPTIVVQDYSTIKSLSDRTAAQVIQAINQGVSAGLSRSTIVDDIVERFDVARSNAKRIADTEINRAYNDGKLTATQAVKTETGIRTGVLHISALLPTTRDSHADRHGNAYTVEEQIRWWDSGVNRINCKCSTSSVLIDNQGNIINTEDQATLEAERRIFEQEDFDFEN